MEKERIIYVNKPTQFRSVTVPDQAQQFSDKAFTFTKEFLLPYQAIKAHVKPGKKKKIYLTRREFKNVAVCFNEKYFEEFFMERGFEVVSPEKMSVEEQISLVMGADEIATTMGTLAHWVIFAKPTARFIMLNRTKNYVSPRQCQLIEAFNFRNYYIVDGSHNFMFADHTRGVNMLEPNKNWKDFVADYFNEHIEDDYASLEKSLEEYVNLWCERYSDPEKSVVTNSLKDLCRRIITLESGDIKRPLLTYQTHVHKRGWGDGWKVENQSSNPIDQERDIQAIKIDFPSHKVYYAVYCNEEESWLEATAPEMAGHVGGHKPIHGMKVRLDEAGAKEFDVLYRMHKFDGTWTPWAKNGEELYSHEQNLNAIQIKLKSIKPAETSAKQIGNPQPLLKDDEIYLQGQRQSLI